MSRILLYLLTFGVLLFQVDLGEQRCSAQPSTNPSTAPDDRALWSKLTDIDERAGRVRSLAADFRQEKFTALLNKPLISSGRVRVKGAMMRWDTREPEPSVMRIDQHEARIYYPAQKTLEIYPLDQRLGELAASPLPRLDILRARFSFEQVPVSDLEKNAGAGRFIALRLTPTEASLREHIQQVRVLLDVQTASMVKAEVTDSDGDRTVLSFSNVQLNVDVGDLGLKVPPGTTVTHPLDGLDGSAAPSHERAK